MSNKNSGACKFTMFSSMFWIDFERKDTSSSNERTRHYYDTLEAIKRAQDNGSISDEMYAKVNSWFGTVDVEEGYYLSNIHYDLFYDVEPTESIELRILHFLEVGDPIVIKNNSYICDNFLTELRYLIRTRREITDWDCGGDNLAFFDKHANELEQEIVEKFISITKKKRPVIREMNIKKYNLVSKKFEMLSISFEKFGYLFAPMGKDGRIYKKRIDGKWKKPKAEVIDKIFDEVYPAIEKEASVPEIKKNTYDKYLKIYIETSKGVEEYFFIDEAMDEFIEKLAEAVNDQFDEVHYLDFLKKRKQYYVA